MASKKETENFFIRPALLLLTERQLEVFLLLGEGKGPIEVGLELNISRKTVSSHREAIMDKMGFRNSYDLIHYAVKNRYT